MRREALIAIGCGLASAVVFEATLAGNLLAVLLSYFGVLPILYVGMGYAMRAALVAVTAAAGALVFLGGPVQFAAYMLAFGLPSLLAVKLALARYADPKGQPVYVDSGRIIAGLSAAAATLLVATGLGMIWEGQDPQIVVANALQTMADTMGAPNMVHMGAYLPGILFGSWVMMMAVNLLIAQSILVRRGRNLRPTPSLSMLRLPDWTLIAFVAALAVAFLGPESTAYLARNTAMVLAVPFLVQGLGLVHVVTRPLPYRTWILTAFYAVTIASVVALVALPVLGLIEHLLKLRERTSPPSRSDEEER